MTIAMDLAELLPPPWPIGGAFDSFISLVVSMWVVTFCGGIQLIHF